MYRWVERLEPVPSMATPQTRLAKASNGKNRRKSLTHRPHARWVGAIGDDALSRPTARTNVWLRIVLGAPATRMRSRSRCAREHPRQSGTASQPAARAEVGNGSVSRDLAPFLDQARLEP